MSLQAGPPLAAVAPLQVDVVDVVEVAVVRLDPEVPLPAYARPGDAGCDLVSTVDAVLAPGERVLVPTGVALALPEGWAGFVHPRSGLAARHGLGIVNAPGTVDAGYRGEIKVALVNHDLHEPVHVRRLDRVAQLVVQRVAQVRWQETDRLPVSVRGSDGHGSTGGHASVPGDHHDDDSRNAERPAQQPAAGTRGT